MMQEHKVPSSLLPPAVLSHSNLSYIITIFFIPTFPTLKLLLVAGAEYKLYQKESGHSRTFSISHSHHLFRLLSH